MVDTGDNSDPNLDPSWLLVGLFFGFFVTSILCHLEIQSFQGSLDADPVPKTGKEMRLVFLQVLLACNLSRAVSLAIEIPLWSYNYCPTSWGCALVHLIPNLPFLTAYSLLALFWAQLALSITNQHNLSLSPLFKQWNIVLYSIFVLLILLALMNALHRAAFIKAIVILLGFYYLTAFILVVYFGFATFFAFDENHTNQKKRISPGGSPMMNNYRTVMNENQSESSAMLPPNRGHNRSPLTNVAAAAATTSGSQQLEKSSSSSSSSSSSLLLSSSSSSNSSSTSSLLSDRDLSSSTTIIQQHYEKKNQTLKRLLSLCIFTGMIMFLHVLFFLGSFLEALKFSFRNLHHNETAVFLEYLILELIPTFVIMGLIGSWKRRSGLSPNISLSIPTTVSMGNGGGGGNSNHHGNLNREGNNDLRVPQSRMSSSGGLNHEGNGASGGGGGQQVKRSNGNGLGGFRNAFSASQTSNNNGRNPNMPNNVRNGNNIRNNGNGPVGSEFELRVPPPLLPAYQQQMHPPPTSYGGPTLHAPQPIQPVARRFRPEDQHNSSAAPLLHHPQPTMPSAAI